MIDKTSSSWRRLPGHFTKIFTIVSALSCAVVFAATVTTTPETNASPTARGKSPRPLYVYLPASSAFSFQKSTDRISGAAQQPLSNAAPAVPLLPLSHEARPTRSLVLGFLPPKGPVNTPGPYQYATIETEASGCRTADRPPNNAAETSDSGNKALRLPIGWSLEMCLHF